MKTKLKGQSGIKGLFLVHGEKLLIAAVVLASAYLAYSALSVERLSDQYEASKLQNEIQRTSASITSEENNWPKAVREQPDKVKVDVPIKAESMAVMHESYDPKVNLDLGVIADKTPRTDPMFLAAVDVRAVSGVDRFAFNDETYMKQRELQLREEAAKKEADRRRQDLLQKQDDSGGRGSGKRGRDDPARGDDWDPDHPHRRRIDGSRLIRGVQLQGGELIELSRWVSVVAKVPIKNQSRIYHDAFENKSGGGFDPERDSPFYRGYLVERAEVVPGQAVLQWQPVSVFDAKGTPSRRRIGGAMSNAENTGTYFILDEIASTEWAKGEVSEVVAPQYLSPEGGLVYPLPPVVGREWGREATHPDIPLATDAPIGGVAGENGGAVSLVPERRPDGDVFGAGGGISTGGQGGGRGDPSERGGRGPSFERGGRPEISTGRSAGRGGGFSSRGRGDAGDARGGGGRQSGMQSASPTSVSDYLLRFFDFTAEPGKQYTYRVQLVLIDPNMHLFATPNILDEAVIKRLRAIPKNPQTGLPSKNWVTTPWSDPSPPVGIPLDGRVRLAGVVPGEDPKVNLLVDGFGKSPKETNWLQASMLKEFTRGSVVNFVEDAEYVTPEQTHIDKVDSFRFTTGTTVVDMRGGERLGGRNDLTVPSRVLLMSPTGDLTVRQELADAPAVQSHQAVFTKPKGGENRQPAEPGRNR